jgi:hypothetical protein
MIDYKQIEWNVWKRWWTQRIIDDTRDRPEMDAVMRYMSSFIWTFTLWEQIWVKSISKMNWNINLNLYCSKNVKAISIWIERFLLLKLERSRPILKMQLSWLVIWNMLLELVSRYIGCIVMPSQGLIWQRCVWVMMIGEQIWWLKF